MMYNIAPAWERKTKRKSPPKRHGKFNNIYRDISHTPDYELESDKEFIKRMKSNPQMWGAGMNVSGGKIVKRSSGYWNIYKRGELVGVEIFGCIRQKRGKLAEILRSIRNLQGYYVESEHNFKEIKE